MPYNSDALRHVPDVRFEMCICHLGLLGSLPCVLLVLYLSILGEFMASRDISYYFATFHNSKQFERIPLARTKNFH